VYGLVHGTVEVRGSKCRDDMGWGKEDEKHRHRDEAKTSSNGTAITVVV
jgi:hypothetical protein